MSEVERLDAMLLARLAVEHFKVELDGQPWDDIEDPFDLPPNQLFLSLMSAPPSPSPLPALLATLLPDHITEDLLARLYSRFQRNNHVLVTPDAALKPFAHAVLASVSRAVNHSCLPSGVVVTTWVDGKPHVGVRVIRDLAEGDEVSSDVRQLDKLVGHD